MSFPKSFIKAGFGCNSLDKNIPAPLFRRSFNIEVLPEKAELIITGIGFYEVYLNGESITKGYLAPYRSNLDHYIYFDKYNLADKLKLGKNTLGVILGNGFRNPAVTNHWWYDKIPFRGEPLTAFSLELGLGEEKEIILSDKDTRVAPSAIMFDDLHYGEYYDARLEIPDWNLPDFDDSDWENAEIAEPPRGEAVLCTAEPIVLRNSLKPISVTECDGGYIYDFGVVSAGICRLKIKGEKGQKLILRHFETLKDGKPFLRNNRFEQEERFQENEYILKGGDVEEHTPRFTYHGFRYVYVLGLKPHQATEELLTFLELSSEIKRAGDFVCSDEVINKIQEATYRSDITNFHYFPTDCPQREKNGWTADASLSAEQMLFNITPENSYKVWMRNIYKAINNKGQLPGIIPTGGWGYHWGNGPAWDNVIVNLPYYTYIYRGDTEIIKEAAIPLMRYLNYLFSRLNSKGLMEIGLGNWCQVGTAEGNFETPLVVTDTILTHDIAVKAAFIFEALGQEPQKQFAAALAQRVRDAFRRELIDYGTMTIFGNTQTAQAMAIYYGMLEDDEKATALDVLISQIKDYDGHFHTGVLGGRVIYRLLAENGYIDLAYNMIVRPDFPSYGNWIKRGATTLWEAFMPEDSERILSLNHHFWGDVSAFFYTYLAGIRVNPYRNNPNYVNIAPLFAEKLDFVKAYHNLPAGKISVEWKRVAEGFVLKVEADEGIKGEIILPKGYTFKNGKNPIINGETVIIKEKLL